MIQNAARSGWRSTRHRRSKKRRPSTRWRWALQQLIHRGSGSTDSTMTSNPPRRGRRTFPVDYTFCFRMVGRSPRCAACGTRTYARRTRRVRLARRHDDPELMIAHLRARAVHPRRPTEHRSTSCVTHARHRSERTRIVRMERKAARSCHRNQRRGEFTGRSAIHVCNTMRCDSVCSHCLVPVFDASDPLKRWPGHYCAGNRAHGAYRYARSAPCFAVQGRAAGEVTPMQIGPRRKCANVSKVKRPDTVRASGAYARRRRCGNVTCAPARRLPLRDADDLLTIADPSPHRRNRARTSNVSAFRLSAARAQRAR